MNTLGLKRKEKTAQLLWTALILMFFAIQAVIWTVAISITAGDSSHAVVSNYDQQALYWDEVKQRRIASAELGWTVQLNVEEKGDVRGNRTLTVELFDRDHMPINDAVVSLEAFHRGRAAEVQRLSLKRIESGIFAGNILVQNSGQWKLSGTAKVGESHFLFDETIQLDANRNL